MPYLAFSELLNPDPPGNGGHDIVPISGLRPIHIPAQFIEVPAPTEVRKSVSINRKTKLSVLNVFDDISAHVEYPSTGTDTGAVGYLFRQDPNNWRNPANDFAYSQGKPGGRTKLGEDVFCAILVDEDGAQVPCIKSHATCMYLDIYIMVCLLNPK